MCKLVAACMPKAGIHNLSEDVVGHMFVRGLATMGSEPLSSTASGCGSQKRPKRLTLQCRQDCSPGLNNDIQETQGTWSPVSEGFVGDPWLSIMLTLSHTTFRQSWPVLVHFINLGHMHGAGQGSAAAVELLPGCPPACTGCATPPMWAAGPKRDRLCYTTNSGALQRV
jgi:hypothetical protein